MTLISNSLHLNNSCAKMWPWLSKNAIGSDDFSRLLFTLVGVFAILRYTLMYIQSKKGKPQPPPGPRGLPLVGNLPFLEPDLHSYFARLAGTYGPVVKLQLGSKTGILVSSPSMARQVLKDQDITFANRDVPAVGLLATGGNNLVWSPYGPQWRMLRKVCVQKMLSNATLDKFYMLRRREIRRTVEYIHSNVGLPVNVGEQMFLSIVNVVTNMLWGSSSEGDARATIGAEFRQVMSEITEISSLPNVSDFFPVLASLDLQGLCKRIAKPLDKLNGIIEQMVDQRLKTEEIGDNISGEAKDFLHFLIQLKNENDPKTPLTMDHIKPLLVDMVLGGTDTSSNTIDFTLAEVINKPEVMRKAQQELDEVVGRNNIVEEYGIHK